MWVLRLLSNVFRPVHQTMHQAPHTTTPPKFAPAGTVVQRPILFLPPSSSKLSAEKSSVAKLLSEKLSWEKRLPE